MGGVAMGHSSLSLWEVLVSQLLSQEPLPHRRTLKSSSEHIPGWRRVDTL